FARIGEKDIPRAHYARVRHQAAHGHPLGTQGSQNVGNAHAHYMLSRTCWSSVPSCIGLSGASCCTPRVRSAPAMSCANTGPATWPPYYLPAPGSSIMTATIRRGSETGARPTKEAIYLLA